MPRSLVTREERLRTSEQPAPVSPQVHASDGAVLALQRSAGNRAVARALGKRVIARMQSFTDFLGKKGLPTKMTYREYRMKVGFSKEVEAALTDRTRSEANRAAIKTLQTAIDGALTDNVMSALVNAVDGIALVITDRAKTISDVPGWGEEEVTTQPAPVEAGAPAAGDGAPAPPAGYAIRAKARKKSGFKTKLTTKEADELMGIWAAELNLARLSPGRETSEILYADRGTVLSDSHIRLDGEAVQSDGRYQVFRIQGSNNKYPVLGGLYLQLNVAFTPEALRGAFRQALGLAHQGQYAVLFDGGAYRAPL
jgi:hypothetical protein